MPPDATRHEPGHRPGDEFGDGHGQGHGREAGEDGGVGEVGEDAAPVRAPVPGGDVRRATAVLAALTMGLMALVLALAPDPAVSSGDPVCPPDVTATRRSRGPAVTVLALATGTLVGDAVWEAHARHVLHASRLRRTEDCGVTPRG